MSNLNVASISNASGTGPANLYMQCAVKVWANLNGTGTIALRDSLNVSSTTDNGTGDYTYNFSAAMSDANYAAQVTMTRGSRVIPHFDFIMDQNAGSWRSTCSDTPNAASVAVAFTDTSRHLFCVIGELA